MRNESMALKPYVRRSLTLASDCVKDFLLNRAGDVGKNVGRVGANKLHRPYDNDENHREHDGILRDVLTLLVAPKID